MRFVGQSLTPDGAKTWRRQAEEPCRTVHAAAALGERLGQSLRQEAGDALYRD
jgi:hypothetical protein